MLYQVSSDVLIFSSEGELELRKSARAIGKRPLLCVAAETSFFVGTALKHILIESEGAPILNRRRQLLWKQSL